MTTQRTTYGTPAQIAALRDEAFEAGDLALANLAQRALSRRGIRPDAPAFGLADEERMGCLVSAYRNR